MTAREVSNSTAKMFSDFEVQHAKLMKQLNIGTGLPNRRTTTDTLNDRFSVPSLETYAQIKNSVTRFGAGAGPMDEGIMLSETLTRPKSQASIGSVHPHKTGKPDQQRSRMQLDFK